MNSVTEVASGVAVTTVAASQVPNEWYQALVSSAGSYIPFILMLTIVAGILIRAHLSDPSQASFNLFDLIQDKETGKGSIEKVFVLLAGLSVTWWFIDMVARHVATWEDALAYGGLLGLAKVANSFISAKYLQKSSADLPSSDN